jgi:hypothetical protein
MTQNATRQVGCFKDGSSGGAAHGAAKADAILANSCDSAEQTEAQCI